VLARDLALDSTLLARRDFEATPRVPLRRSPRAALKRHGWGPGRIACRHVCRPSNPRLIIGKRALPSVADRREASMKKDLRLAQSSF
jgi:hypothetical protein